METFRLELGSANLGPKTKTGMTMSEAVNLIVVWLIVGLIAGGLASQIVKRHGLSLLGNLAVGLMGSIIGGALLGFLLNIQIGELGGRMISAFTNATIGIHIDRGILAATINATIGAVALLFIYWLVERE